MHLTTVFTIFLLVAMPTIRTDGSGETFLPSRMPWGDLVVQIFLPVKSQIASTFVLQGKKKVNISSPSWPKAAFSVPKIQTASHFFPQIWDFIPACSNTYTLKRYHFRMLVCVQVSLYAQLDVQLPVYECSACATF